MKKKALFICSPNAGYLDIILPIIFCMKNDLEFDILFPKEEQVVDLDSNRITNIEKNFSNVFLLKNKNICIVDRINLKNCNKKTIINFLKNFLSKFFFNHILFNLMKTLEYKIRTMRMARFLRYISLNQLTNYDVVFFDATEIRKSYFSIILKYIKNLKKISINHGSDPVAYNKDIEICEKVIKNNYQILYTVSEDEKDYYKKIFNFENFLMLGNPKHDLKWISQNLSKSMNDLKEKENLIFLISRPADRNYLPIDRKIKALKLINKYLYKTNFKLIVKLHPKEEDISGKSIYLKYLGKENFGKRWFIENDNVFEIGSKCKFAISFFSGVSADLLQINVPTIEFLDLKGLEYKNIGQIFYINNKPVFKTAYYKIVQNVCDEKEFEKAFFKCINNLNEVLSDLKYNYDTLYYKADLNIFKRELKKIL